MTVPATRRQQDLLRFIAGYQEAHGGVSPCFQEMKVGMNSNCHSGIFRLLGGLEERGHLRRLPNRARAIEPTWPIPIPRSPSGEPLYFIPIGGRD